MSDIIEKTSGWSLKFNQDFIEVNPHEGAIVNDCLLMAMYLDSECPTYLRKDNVLIPKTIPGMKDLYCRSCPYSKIKHGIC